MSRIQDAVLASVVAVTATFTSYDGVVVSPSRTGLGGVIAVLEVLRRPQPRAWQPMEVQHTRD